MLGEDEGVHRFKFVLGFICVAAACLGSGAASAAEAGRPVLVGLDAAFSLKYSTSAQSLERGARTAIHQINEAGGVLGGRPLELVVRDNHSVPARGLENFEELAALEDLVAIIGSRFSAVVLAQAKMAHERGVPLFAAWSSANGITNMMLGPHTRPSYVFRLSLRDSLAMPAMLGHAVERGFQQVGLTLLATAWGRSNEQAAKQYVARAGYPSIVHINWAHWRENNYGRLYSEHLRAGADAVVVVGNDEEVAHLVDVVARHPRAERLPLISHWGVTGGNFSAQLTVPEALKKVDLSMVQTFSFFSADRQKVAEVLKVTNELFGLARAEDIAAPVGFAHAYDLVHILARAIERAGSTDRRAIRDALEQVRDYHGLVRHFERPFSPVDHEALKQEDVFMARYAEDGSIVPVGE